MRLGSASGLEVAGERRLGLTDIGWGRGHGYWCGGGYGLAQEGGELGIGDAHAADAEFAERARMCAQKSPAVKPG